MRNVSRLLIPVSFSALLLAPVTGESAAVAVTSVTVTTNPGSGCNKKKTSSLATVPVSRQAHSITIDWVHYITAAGVIAGVHSGTESTSYATNSLTHSDDYSANPGTNIIVHAEASFSMQYCGTGGQLIEWTGVSKSHQSAC